MERSHLRPTLLRFSGLIVWRSPSEFPGMDRFPTERRASQALQDPGWTPETSPVIHLEAHPPLPHSSSRLLCRRLEAPSHTSRLCICLPEVISVVHALWYFYLCFFFFFGCCLSAQAENSALSMENDNQRKQYERCLDEVSCDDAVEGGWRVGGGVWTAPCAKRLTVKKNKVTFSTLRQCAK